MRLSILVVSRTPSLLSSMLKSVAEATELPGLEVEVLCSWNGSKESENEIDNSSGYELLIAQREPYHFASNMNELAVKANGELLLLINDDIVLDAGSIDSAINCLEQEPQAGLVGGRLRNHQGQLIHAGILFDSRNSPYHLLDRLVPAEFSFVMGNNRVVPAVTGALMLLRRKHFLEMRFNESYKVCGEDVDLCLDVRERLKLEVWYCPAASGIHESESTRQQQENQEAQSEDLSRMRMRHRQFIEQANETQLLNDLLASTREAESLRDVEVRRQRETINLQEIIISLEKMKRDGNNNSEKKELDLQTREIDLQKGKKELDLQTRELDLGKTQEKFDSDLKKRELDLQKGEYDLQKKLKELPIEIDVQEMEDNIEQLSTEVIYWQNQSNSLQLSRLRQQQELDNIKQELKILRARR